MIAALVKTEWSTSHLSLLIALSYTTKNHQTSWHSILGRWLYSTVIVSSVCVNFSFKVSSHIDVPLWCYTWLVGLDISAGVWKLWSGWNCNNLRFSDLVVAVGGLGTSKLTQGIALPLTLSGTATPHSNRPQNAFSDPVYIFFARLQQQCGFRWQQTSTMWSCC